MGKFADFVVLSGNILQLDGDELKEVRVLRTFVGGELVFEAE